MKCINCGVELPPNSLFCFRCGRKVDETQVCPNPGCEKTGLPKEASFCPECGTRLKKRDAPSSEKGVKDLIEMVKVEGGTFRMGSDAWSQCQPIHEVALSTYYISKYLVTQKLWKEVMATNPSHFVGENLPVERASWYDAINFCNALSKKAGFRECYLVDGDYVYLREDGNGYRLPTEAEWEYAARGGNKTRNYSYSGDSSVAHVGWYKANSGHRTHAVGLKQPNELGLYDMSGNVDEWCWDRYEDKYRVDIKLNPLGPPTGFNHVKRGGSWRSSSEICSVALRDRNLASCSLSDLGFRVVLNSSSK